MIRNYQDLTRLEMEQLDRKHTIVLIPLGALEQHGNQAPLGTDDIIANAMVSYLKEELEAVCEDFPMLVFPVIPVGLSTEHKNFCGSVTFRPDTYYHLLYDICESLARHGFKKIAFLICHGGNAPLVQILSRELRSDLGLYAFYLSSGAFSHPDVKATVSPGNIWDFHDGDIHGYGGGSVPGKAGHRPGGNPRPIPPHQGFKALRRGLHQLDVRGLENGGRNTHRNRRRPVGSHR